MTADLSNLTIGSLTLTPAFDAGTTTYTATTSNATNKVDVVAKDSNAAVEIKHGSDTIQNGSSVTWTPGENILTVTVTAGESVTKTYTVTVTKN